MEATAYGLIKSDAAMTVAVKMLKRKFLQATCLYSILVCQFFIFFIFFFSFAKIGCFSFQRVPI